MNGDNPNLADLLKQLRDDTTLLVREEVALAKTEVSEKVKTLSRSVIMMIAGGLLAWAALTPLLFAFGFLLRDLFVHFGTGEGTGTFLGLLIVALVTGGIGAGIIVSALSAFKKENLKPNKTIQTLTEDKEWIQTKLP